MKNYSRFFLRLAVGLFCISLCPVDTLQAQISEGGLPPSFEFSTNLRSTKQAVQVPVDFSVEDLKVVDAWRVSQGAPMRVAKSIPVAFDLNRDAEWITLPDGRKITQLHLQAKGAIALILYYSDFYIPQGAQLYIYNADKTQVLGAYTERTHPQNGVFATQPVAGDELVLEYVPASSGEEPQVKISEIGYGYNHLSIAEDIDKAPGDGRSTSCEVNVNCEEGADWQLQKKGVVQMLQYIDKATYICTGALVNNTAKDKKPYILSAFHCSQNMEGTAQATDKELEQWMFIFHQERPGCDNESKPAKLPALIGCSRKVAIPIEEGSDGLLLLLTDTIPENYDVFFNGWDRTNTPSLSGVGLHHPAGDYMKISTYGNYPTESVTWNNSDVDATGAVNAHWNVTFDATSNGHGITEGGSSGSPLFNSKGLIIGTLSGGNSSCDMPEGLNLYGKLYYHWNKYDQTDSSRYMAYWLDSLNTGVTSLAGLTQSGQSLENEYKGPVNLTYRATGEREIELKWETPIYTQLTGWGTQNRTYKYGLKGEPFYYAQCWDTNDLKPVHKNIITHVNFFPESNVTYGVYIKQGNRIYEEEDVDFEPSKLNSIALKTPFVIDAHQDLLVAIHVKKYSRNVYPAYADEGPAVNEKGNLYSTDGKKWETFDENELDANAILSIIISSQTGELPSSYTLASTARIAVLRTESASTPQLTVEKVNQTSDLPEGFPIAAFPELSGYKIYRDFSLLTTLPASRTEYTVKNVSPETARIQVSALYNENESAPATAVLEGTVGNEPTVGEVETDIQPRVFRETIQIRNYQQLESLEIYSADGKQVRKVIHPQSSLDTSTLPQGMYIFRLSTDKETKTIQGIKQ